MPRCGAGSQTVGGGSLVHMCRVSFLGAGSDDRGAGSQTRLDPAERKHCLVPR